MIGQGEAYIPGEIAGNRRVVIRDMQPQIDAGEYAVKRIVGDTVEVSAAVFSDSHDVLGCHLLYRHQDESDWTLTRLSHQGNDIWKGEFKVTTVGLYTFTVQGWVDHFDTWHRDLQKRVAAGQELNLPLLTGALLLEEARRRARGSDAEALSFYASEMRAMALDPTLKEYICPEPLVRLMEQIPDLRFATTYHRSLKIIVDRVRAQYSTWYELFPRSCAEIAGSHGTLRDCEKRLPILAGLGFDVLYLPPIHPIGLAFRKGRNNNTTAESGDVGSTWAIGTESGGHKAIHPQLGSVIDFLSLVETAKDHGMEVALDIAFQCSPDHPYVKQHPEWFLKRPDGSIQYAENPPKRYQDIYPLDFETASWWELWSELKTIFVYWMEFGVRIFRVDNPHTKAFSFWRWVIPELKKSYPDGLFLAEAFTRPHPMYELAKLGFSQSYTYFTWRNNKDDLITYLTELTTSPVNEFFRPNFWPNTPDILPYPLQGADPKYFAVRLILASTLSSNYGIYGSAFELSDNLPKEEGSEEYLNSEKYELKVWNNDPDVGLRPLIRTINGIRARNPALHQNDTLHFHMIDNPFLIAYSKAARDESNVILVIVNLDPQHSQSGVLTLDSQSVSSGKQMAMSLKDLLSEEKITLTEPACLIEFGPGSPVAKIYAVTTVGVL